METGTIACCIFILLSCGGEESLELDGQHKTGAPVTLALTALSNRMTHTPPSYTNPHPRIRTHTRTHTMKPLSQKERLFCWMLQGLVLWRSVGTGGLNTDRLQDQRGCDKAQERAQGSRANEEVEGEPKEGKKWATHWAGRQWMITHTAQVFSLGFINYGRNSSIWRHKALCGQYCVLSPRFCRDAWQKDINLIHYCGFIVQSPPKDTAV